MEVSKLTEKEMGSRYNVFSMSALRNLGIFDVNDTAVRIISRFLALAAEYMNTLYTR